MTTPSRSGLLGPVALAFLVGALAFSWRESSRVSAADADHYAFALRELDRQVSTLQFDVLRARFGLLNTYDSLARGERETRAALAALAPPAYFNVDDQRALAQSVHDYQASIEDLLQSAERFKARNAVARNSVHYAPTLADEVDADGATGTAVDSGVRALLAVLIAPTAEHNSALARAAERVAAAPAVGEQKAQLALLARHMKTIATVEGDVDGLVQHIVSPSTVAAREAVAATHARGFAHVEARQRAYRVAMFAASLALVGGIAYAFVRLRRALSALADANRTLEARVAERTAALAERTARMRLVLDQVQQGLAVVDEHGAIDAEHSAAFAKLSTDGAPTNLARFIAGLDANAGEWLRLGWRDLFDDIMPVDVVADQLPRTLTAGERSYDVAYHPIYAADGKLSRVLVTVSDGTDRVQRERSEREGRDVLGMMEISSQDVGFLRQTIAEIDAMLASLTASTSTYEARMRALHTVKGLTRMIGAYGVGEQCHHLESLAAEAGDRALPAGDVDALCGTWSRLREKVVPLFGEADEIVISRAALESLKNAALHATRGNLVERLERLERDDAAALLARYAHEAEVVGVRLQKPVEVDVDAADVRLPRNLRAVWPTLVHVVRNAVDHGIEDAATRLARDKPAQGHIVLAARDTVDAYVVSVKDDGGGVDFDALRAACLARGVACDSPVEALFADGVSTKSDVSDLSGRGVGMAAVREVVRGHGGDIDVVSSSGGTTITLRFPKDALRALAEADAAAPQ